MAWDKFFLEGLQSGVEIALKKKMMEQEAEKWKEEKSIKMLSANLVPDPQGAISMNGEKYSRLPLQTPDLSNIFKNSGGTPPVGTTVSYNTDSGGVTVNAPLNPALSTEAVKSLSSEPEITKNVDTILNSMDKVGLGDPKNFMTQKLFDTGWFPLMGKNEDLKKIANSRNILEKYVLFDEAGKALTGPEKSIMLQQFDTTGLNKDQIIANYTLMKDVAQRRQALYLQGKSASEINKDSIDYINKGKAQSGIGQVDVNSFFEDK